MTLGYYPGCSLHSSAAEYNMSVMAVFKALGMELSELEEWSCCGATPGHSVDSFLSYALPIRNLILAEVENKKDLVLPCAACYNLLKSADHEFKNDACLAKKANEELKNIMGVSYQGSVNVLHPLDIFVKKENKEKIIKQVKNPLKGLKIVTYYGCLLTRPAYVAVGDAERPETMDDIMRIIGADVKKWSHKTECCGGSLSLARTDLVVELVNNLAAEAKRAGVDAIVSACPLCQGNLDSRQDKKNGPIPVFFFTELMGISFSHSDYKKWMKRHLVNPLPLLNSLQLAY